MKNAKNNNRTVAQSVTPIAEKTAAELGLKIWDVEFLREGSDDILRITIDKTDEEVTIDDCEAFHNAIDPRLDEADPIDGSYCLQVSSPGIEREIRTPEHIYACLGEKVDIKLYSPLDGSKTFTGIIKEFDGKTLTAECAGGTREFGFETIAKMNLHYDFD